MRFGLLSASSVYHVNCPTIVPFQSVRYDGVPFARRRLVCEKWVWLRALSVAVNVFLSKSMDNTRRGLVLFPTLLYFLFFALVTMCFVCLIRGKVWKWNEWNEHGSRVICCLL